MRSGLALAAAGALAAALSGGPAGAATSDPLASLKRGCSAKVSTDPAPAQRVAYRICEGMVESFDGTPLDVTVTLPAGRPRRRPLVVFLHGFLNNKGEYISQTRAGVGPDRGNAAYKTADFNNVWFASRGYAVLNYSARANGESGGRLEFASPRYEVRDTRYLTGLLTDDARSASPLVRINPRRVGVIGGSYGGIQTWLLLTTRENRFTQYGEWRSPGGRLVRITAAIPQFTSPDLFETLAPNGRVLASSAPAPGRHPSREPFGSPRLALLAGLALSTATGSKGLPGSNFPPETAGYVARVAEGEPYDAASDPEMAAFRRYLADRSAAYQVGFFRALARGRQRVVPILAAQGWTDPIFHAVEPVEMYYRLRRARPRYPIAMYFGDFEHMTALARVADLLYYHRLGNRLLDYYLKGPRRGRRGHRPRPRFDVRSALTNCDPNRFGPVVRARGWSSLARRRVTFELGGPRITRSPLVDPRAVASDPLLLEQARPRLGQPSRGCITTRLPPTPGVAAYTIQPPAGLTLLGLPVLRLAYRALGPDVQFHTRLWDVAPDGTQTLVSRGAYRAVAPRPSGETATFELFGNHWRFEAGHRVLLEVTQDDSPYFRTDNFPSLTTIDTARLTLPVRP